MIKLYLNDSITKCKKLLKSDKRKKANIASSLMTGWSLDTGQKEAVVVVRSSTLHRMCCGPYITSPLLQALKELIVLLLIIIVIHKCH